MLTCAPLTTSQVNEADLAYLLPGLATIFQLPQAELQQSSRKWLSMLPMENDNIQVCQAMLGTY